MRYILIAFVSFCFTSSSSSAQPAQVDTLQDKFVATEVAAVAIDTISRFIEFPEMAKRAGIEGEVTLSALIAKDGTVLRVKILKSSNFIFEKPAFDAMHKVRYKPALSQGKPVQAWVNERVQFRLH